MVDNNELRLRREALQRELDSVDQQLAGKGLVIVIERRDALTVLAYVKGNRAVWGRGSDRESAIGSMVQAFPETFGIANIK